MRRLFLLVCLGLAGCSTAPVAGFLDNCFPSRAKVDPEKSPGVDVKPAPFDPLRPGPPAPGPRPGPGPVPPPDFGPNP
jgi:hypothetical protein